MKLAFYLTLLTLILPLRVFADSGSQGDSRQVTIKISRNPPTSRPRIPSYQRIDASFEKGLLHIEFEKPEGMAFLELFTFDGSTHLNGSFDTSEPYDFKVGDISLPAEFTITTDVLNEYCGLIFEED